MSKSEASPQIPRRNDGNGNALSADRGPVFVISPSCLEFVSDFVLRISDFFRTRPLTSAVVFKRLLTVRSNAAARAAMRKAMKKLSRPNGAKPAAAAISALWNLRHD